MPLESPYRSPSSAMSSEPSRGLLYWVGLVAAGVALILVRGLWVAGLRAGRDFALLASTVPVFALATAAWVALWCSPRAALFALRKRRAEARHAALQAVLGVAFVGSAAGVEREIQRRVDARMETVVAAMTRFREERGHFPVRIDDVVPRYLDAIPTPWPYNAGCGFNYIRTGERVMLLREHLDNDGERPCVPQHGLRYRFLPQRWESW